MPELPEAETIARTLAAALPGGAVTAARLLRRDFLKTGSPRRLRRLAGATLTGMARRGKCVVLAFGADRLVLQLGMSGRVWLDRPGRPVAPHTHLILTFAARPQLRYANSRRIAAGVHLLAGDEQGPLARLGPDADTIGPEAFARRLAGRTAPVKAALLNQALLAGVGNIYADEALFRAGIRPGRRVHRIGRGRLAALHAALRAVLAEAVAAGGSTLDDANPFVGADGELGYFTHAHQVYGRYGQACLRCGRTLRRATVAGRTSTYCPRCQR